MHLEIVTPEKKIFSDTVNLVYLPGADGELGILPMHSALITALAPGELRFEKGSSTQAIAIGNGFAEVTQEKVSVLTDMALGEDEIDEAKVEVAMKRAQDELTALGHGGDVEEIAYLQATIAKSLAQLKLKRRPR
jgi:F-type H+-transporting ATPase subunit epsilon